MALGGCTTERTKSIERKNRIFFIVGPIKKFKLEKSIEYIQQKKRRGRNCRDLSHDGTIDSGLPIVLKRIAFAICKRGSASLRGGRRGKGQTKSA